MSHISARGVLLSSVPLLLLTAAAAGQTSAAPDAPEQSSERLSVPSLETGFRDPPNAARPRVWWHWMNGNITKEGIRKDLEWMKRAGIGGLQNFDAALNTPQVVDKRISYMTPEWKAAFKYSAELAQKLDLELAIAASPGWSETGGPWVPPEDGIKKLVWSQTDVQGGRIRVKLPAPPTTTGPYMDIRAASKMASGGDAPRPELYRDVAVFAYPLSPDPARAIATVSNLGRPLDAAALSDGRFGTSVAVQRDGLGGEGTVEFDYGAPATIRSATVALEGTGRTAFTPIDLLPVLEAQTSAGSWTKVAELAFTADIPTTASFAPVTASRFRIRFQPVRVQLTSERLNAYPGAITSTYRPPAPPSRTINLAEASLSTAPRVDRFEAKAGFSVARDYYALEGAAPGREPGVPRDRVIELTDRMRPDGSLDWTAPAGRWRITRLGWSLTGTLNHPATAEATGLEVDKLDGAAVTRYLDTYLAMFRETVGPDLFGDKGLRAILTDSLEAGAFNWTPEFRARFKAMRGYDLGPFLPALTGTIVGSRAETDLFLYDYRRTIAELLTSQHYGTIARIARRNGLTVYGEALEVARPSLGDDMAMRSHTDVPMAAMWTYKGGGPRSTFLADMKGAASVAHIYGQNLVGAESLTSGMNYWAHAPGDLKPVIDLEFAYGVNRPVIHTSVHQPVERKPGLSLLVFGQFFNRHETWAEMARPWMDYVARSSFLLQRGRYHADLAYFFGEEAPLTALYAERQPKDAPKRYPYDFINGAALRDQVHVQDGELVARGGTRYRAIYLGGSSYRLTLATLLRLEELVAAGATLIGMPPVSSPSLSDDPSSWRSARDRLWGERAGTIDRGRVIASSDAENGLEAIGLRPDVEFLNPQANVLFLHRTSRTDDAEIYFLTNRQDARLNSRARFRVAGKQPELWRADTGAIEPLKHRSDGDSTIVDLDMAPKDAFFVVFRGEGQARVSSQSAVPGRVLRQLQTPWTVNFEPGRGAPTSMRMHRLASLTQSRDPGVRYFSGVATYTSSFDLPASYRAGDPLWLDMGQVGEVAEVRINGRPAGIAWKAPYRLAIGDAVRAGRNEVEIHVANLWLNRLIGDAQPGANKVGFTSLPTFGPDAPLRESGLMGPVTVLAPAR
ncbi:glycoside hydrolase [Sphingomonas sp. MG17]|uniref:Glycoside hydrolase n=1 Tax=Sphingomonas tagetis TaxID=2949092 RepID=A0A9X2KQX0_9SPHN|nr:glycosyl hydrolase [Sphingomonas tagetis]MCP3732238.1 glycoside hydrolase [Sphingomonas tagetis]